MLKAGFILLTVLLAIAIFACASYAAGKAFTRVSEQKRFTVKIAVVLAVWLIYVSLLSIKGVFTIASMPPRIPLLLVLPAFASFVYFFTNSKFKKIIDATPAALPVFVQSFRVFVELLILSMFLTGLLPKTATFEGYNFDILIGLTAPVIGLLAARGIIKKPIMLLWNFAGLVTLLIVVVILLTNAYFPSLWHQQVSILPNGLGIFPFTFLAGFLMPVAVFMHLFSIIKTIRSDR